MLLRRLSLIVKARIHQLFCQVCNDVFLAISDNKNTIKDTSFLLYEKWEEGHRGGAFKSVITMKIQLTHTYENIISVENLLDAWKEFEKGKKNKKDVQEFFLHLMDNIFALHDDLLNHTYNHDSYQAFKINDPKPRDIHKASVRDRLLHHAIYRKLYHFFDKTFINDSYSCRNDKGTHKAINKFRTYTNIVSQNNTKTCWVLKCDIKKFFASIDHEILLDILGKYILDEDILSLLENIISSFSTSPHHLLTKERGNTSVGLPLGNLTSQLFVNIYMNKFDQFVKHKMKVKYYIRYADDFVFLSESKNQLDSYIPIIESFLWKELKLKMHPDKVFIKTLSSGVDFLGIVNFPNHRILRTKTKKRMLRKMKNKKQNRENHLCTEEHLRQSMQSYYGMLTHYNEYKIVMHMRKLYGCNKYQG